MNALIKDCVKLVVITLIAGLALGVVYGITKDPIAAQNEKKQQEAYRQVFPDAESFEEVEGFSPEAASEVIKAYANPIDDHANDEISSAVTALDASGAPLGYIFNVTTGKGYGGDIQLTVGIQADGTVNGYSVLSIGETAGLGMKATTDEFKNQFRDKNVEKFEYTKNGATEDYQIDALSGATITTNAMTNGVNAGLCAFQYEKGGN